MVDSDLLDESDGAKDSDRDAFPDLARFFLRSLVAVRSHLGPRRLSWAWACGLSELALGIQRAAWLMGAASLRCLLGHAPRRCGFWRRRRVRTPSAFVKHVGIGMLAFLVIPFASSSGARWCFSALVCDDAIASPVAP